MKFDATLHIKGTVEITPPREYIVAVFSEMFGHPATEVFSEEVERCIDSLEDYISKAMERAHTVGMTEGRMVALNELRAMYTEPDKPADGAEAVDRLLPVEKGIDG